MVLRGAAVELSCGVLMFLRNVVSEVGESGRGVTMSLGGRFLLRLEVIWSGSEGFFIRFPAYQV